MNIRISMEKLPSSECGRTLGLTVQWELSHHLMKTLVSTKCHYEVGVRLILTGSKAPLHHSMVAIPVTQMMIMLFLLQNECHHFQTLEMF